MLPQSLSEGRGRTRTERGERSPHGGPKRALFGPHRAAAVNAYVPTCFVPCIETLDIYEQPVRASGTLGGTMPGVPGGDCTSQPKRAGAAAPASVRGLGRGNVGARRSRMRSFRFIDRDAREQVSM